MHLIEWSRLRATLNGFGGSPVHLKIRKTGLPYYDALRLYGAIDLYIGTREDIEIYDQGYRWEVTAKTRTARVHGRDLNAFKVIRGSKRKPQPVEFCLKLRQSLTTGIPLASDEDPSEAAKGELQGLDPVLQSGVRGQSAVEYESMNSSASPRCIAKLPLSEAILACAGARRTETIGDVRFIPIFEGKIDLGKLVNPIRAWLAIPNPLCAQVLILLSLKTSLWAEGYDRDFVLAYCKMGRGSFNYSGIIEIRNTAIGKLCDSDFCANVHQVFRKMVNLSWTGGKAAPMAPYTLAVANWLMQPVPKNLFPMIGAQEYLAYNRQATFLISPSNVKEVFEMTYPARDSIDHETIRKFAKAASSAIRVLGRGKNDEDRRKRWYDEVVALRNSPTKDAFRNRVLILIEQSRRQDDWVGSSSNYEDFDPASLFDVMDAGFEEFRDCFRMYLIEESARKRKAEIMDNSASDGDQPGANEDGTQEQSE